MEDRYMIVLGSELHARMVLRRDHVMVEPCCSNDQACILADAKNNTLALNQQAIPREVAPL